MKFLYSKIRIVILFGVIILTMIPTIIFAMALSALEGYAEEN